MPKMGDAMEEGTLVKWLVSEGDEVSEGDAIAEIETDKASMEIEAEDSGTLAQFIASEGDDVPVGEAIAFIQGEGEEVPERDGSAAEGGGEAEEETEEGGDGQAQAQTATETEEEAAEEQPQAGGEPSGDGAQTDGQVRASPIVRRLARENNLDLSRIEGSGPQGRVVERDVRAALESGEAPTTDGQAEVEAPEEPQQEQAAQQQIPHFYATVEVEMDATLALRKQLNEQLEEEGLKLSVNDFVMKACAVALRDYPNLNAIYTSKGIELHEKVDLAMAVALDAGLITPVIKDIASKGLATISRESKDLAQRARDGDLTPEEYQGGTITVSNMGMFGVESFTAIINPPQAAIVAVSGIVKRPTYNEDDELVPASMMKLTLSADHRIANGRDGALYMSEVKRILENPMLLMV